jgi:hypothetical protein
MLRTQELRVSQERSTEARFSPLIDPSTPKLRMLSGVPQKPRLLALDSFSVSQRLQHRLPTRTRRIPSEHLDPTRRKRDFDLGAGMPLH